MKCGNCQRNNITYSTQASALNLPDAAAHPISGGMAPGKHRPPYTMGVFRLSGVYNIK
jgi:hypothetical protein